jgi:hypothetical protein
MKDEVLYIMTYDSVRPKTNFDVMSTLKCDVTSIDEECFYIYLWTMTSYVIMQDDIISTDER